MKKIGFPNLSFLPSNNRIRNLYDEYRALLSKKFMILNMPAFREHMKTDERETMTRKFIDEIDVFFGYDRQFMRTRRNCHKKPAIILPMFANMTRGGITIWMNRNYFNTNDVLMFSSLADKAIYSEAVTEATVKAIVLPLPLSSCYEQQFQSCGVLRKKEEIGPIRILYVGRLVKEKNIQAIVQVCSILKNRMDFSMTMIGNWYDSIDDGRYKREIQKLIADLNLTEKIIFKGYLQERDLVDEYQKSDILINLSTNPDENFGLAIVEALSQSLPIVCTDWGGFKDHVISGWNGYKVKTNIINNTVAIDINEAVEYLYMLRSSTLRKRMGKNSNDLYNDKYGRCILLKKLEMIILSRKEAREAVVKFDREAMEYCLKYVFGCAVKCKEPDVYFGQKHYVSQLMEEIDENCSGED